MQRDNEWRTRDFQLEKPFTEEENGLYYMRDVISEEYIMYFCDFQSSLLYRLI